MSADEVADKCVERIESGAYDVIILNFANCDMVGHTGVFDAAVRAVETVDTCVGRVVDATMKMGGIAMITADHGNAEVMTQPDGSPMTAHTTNPVPFILCGAGTELRKGRLADIAPTILDVMGLAVPEEMDGQTPDCQITNLCSVPGSIASGNCFCAALYGQDRTQNMNKVKTVPMRADPACLPIESPAASHYNIYKPLRNRPPLCGHHPDQMIEGGPLWKLRR